MPIDNINKYFFVHIPKTAGVSLATSLGIKFDGHRQFSYYENLVNKGYKSFAVVRNPYDRFISNYFYALQKNTKNLPRTQHRSNKHWDLDLLYDKSVKECVQILKNNPNQLKCKGWNHQYLYICDENDNILVDKLLYFENLEKDFKKLCNEWNLPNSGLITDNETDHDIWENYLDENDKEIIYNYYKKDFDILNYVK